MHVKLVELEDGGGRMLEIGSRITVTFINQWRQFLNLKQYNWVTFTPIKLELEYEGYSNMYDLELYVLGFGINIRYDLDFENSEIKQRGDEVWEKIQRGDQELYRLRNDVEEEREHADQDQDLPISPHTGEPYDPDWGTHIP